MNVWNERYPSNLIEELKEADEASQYLKEGVRNGPKLKELFFQREKRIYKKSDFFEQLKTAPNYKSKSRKKNNAFSGLYLFAEPKTLNPAYVGISNTIARRMKQHGWGTGHNQSSFAYLMAKHEEKHQGPRNEIDLELLREYQQRVQEMTVAVWPLLDPWKMYFFEAAVAALLKTKWNSFKTH